MTCTTSPALRAGSCAGRTSSAEGLLRSLALVEDSRVDEHDDRNEASLQLQRLEAKLDLAMVLLGLGTALLLWLSAMSWLHRGRLLSPERA